MRDVMLFIEQLYMLESQHGARTPPGAPLLELRGCHQIFLVLRWLVLDQDHFWGVFVVCV